MDDQKPTEVSTSEQQAPWNASQYEAALAHLEQLQEQVID